MRFTPAQWLRTAVNELHALGAEVQRGTLDDLALLTETARACDATAHLAMNRPERNAQYRLEPNAYVKNNAMDRAAIQALLAAKRPLVMTSGTAITSTPRSGTMTTEDDGPALEGLGAIRGPAEGLALEGGATVLRLPVSVHGPKDRGFVPGLIGAARKHGFAAYVGDGANRWPTVHRADAARLYRLALENPARVAGKRLHGVAEEGVTTHAIAEAIGAGLNVPVRSITAAEATDHFDWLGRFVGMDIPTSSAQTRALLDWTPREVGLLNEMIVSGYFTAR